MGTNPEHLTRDDGAAIADHPSIAKRQPFRLRAMTLPVGLVAALLVLLPLTQIAPSPNRNLSGGDDADPATRAPTSSDFPRAMAGRVTMPSVAVPIKFTGDLIQRSNAADCLAAAAWYESGDDEPGQRAVIQTVLNRVKHPGFPNSVCGVVFQGSHLPTGCQFTFTCDGSLARRRPSPRAWQAARAAALNALDGFVEKSIGTATHYHADYVSPWWSQKLERLTSVGPHIFYRWSDRRGSLPQTVQLAAERDYAELVRQSYAFASSGPTIVDVDPSAALPDLAGTDAPLIKDVARQPVIGTAEIMAFEDRSASGRWAITAMKSCGDKRGCQIIGYADKDVALLNRRRAPETRDRPLFLFIRDKASGMELALWDCDQVKRVNLSQCLPTNPSALASLMTER